jgi:hypothetical protein|tara:strand:+ start:125 stop:2302 length:2178 start_codon:yes stop_codon:yes gene_type:complete
MIKNLHFFKVLLLSAIFGSYLSANAPVIDGVIEKDEWLNATEYELELEVSPARNAPALLKTFAKIKHDDENLYVAFRAFADKDEIRATIRSRDTGWLEDYVGVVIDTFGDDRYAIALGVNALGSQLDLKQTPGDRDEDTSWNILFFAETSFTDYGYSAEFKIPFAELRYPDEEVQEWSIGFVRKSFEPGTQTIFADFTVYAQDQCFFCATDEVYVIQDLEETNRNYVYPYITVNQKADRPVDNLKYQNPDYEIGVSGLLDLDENNTIEYTINPDFSQVEADAAQILVNETFAVSLEERRTFFLEGTDLLDTDLDSVYTRSINNPLNAIKFINQSDKTSSLFMRAQDTDSPYLAGGLYQSYSGNAGKSEVSILRSVRNYENQSNIGLLLTNRDYHRGGHGRLVEVDANIRFQELYRLQLDFAKSYTQESDDNFLETEDSLNGITYAMDGENFRGDAKNIRFVREGDGNTWGARLEDISPNYRADVGFVRQTGFKQLNFWHSRQYRSNNFFRLMSPRIILRERSDYEGNQISDMMEIGARFETSINLRGNIERKIFKKEQFKDYLFNEDQVRDSLWLGYSPSEAWGINLNADYGDRIAYNEDIPVIGDQANYTLFLALRPTDNLSIFLNKRKIQLKDKLSGEDFYNGSVDRITTNYSFSNDLSFKVNIESNDFSDDYYLETLFKWSPDPYTIFYAGSSQFLNDGEPGGSLQLYTSQIYLKFQYFYQG